MQDFAKIEYKICILLYRYILFGLTGFAWVLKVRKVQHYTKLSEKKYIEVLDLAWMLTKRERGATLVLNYKDKKLARPGFELWSPVLQPSTL